MTAGVLLAIAIAVVVAASALLPKAEGFTNLPWTIAVMSGYVVAIWLLTVIFEGQPFQVPRHRLGPSGARVHMAQRLLRPLIAERQGRPVLSYQPVHHLLPAGEQALERPGLPPLLGIGRE